MKKKILAIIVVFSVTVCLGISMGIGFSALIQHPPVQQLLHSLRQREEEPSIAPLPDVELIDLGPEASSAAAELEPLPLATSEAEQK